MPQRLSIVLIFVAATFITLIALAGHNPWTGVELFQISGSHGVNSGDLAPLTAWAVTTACCVHLWRRAG